MKMTMRFTGYLIVCSFLFVNCSKDETVTVANCPDPIGPFCGLNPMSYVVLPIGSWWTYKSNYSSRPFQIDSTKTATRRGAIGILQCERRYRILDENYYDCDDVVIKSEPFDFVSNGYIEFVCIDPSLNSGQSVTTTIKLDNHPTDTSTTMNVVASTLEKTDSTLRIREQFFADDGGIIELPYNRLTTYKLGIGIIRRDRTVSQGVHRIDLLEDYFIK